MDTKEINSILLCVFGLLLSMTSSALSEGKRNQTPLAMPSVSNTKLIIVHWYKCTFFQWGGGCYF